MKWLIPVHRSSNRLGLQVLLMDQLSWSTQRQNRCVSVQEIYEIAIFWFLIFYVIRWLAKATLRRRYDKNYQWLYEIKSIINGQFIND